MKKNILAELVKKAVRKIEPDAEIYLYGSRSRGDYNPGSDWDFLILVDGVLNDERIDRIRHQLYELEWEYGEVISSIIRTRNQWNSPLFKAMPFYNNIERDGIRL
ncbi:MAG: nucleotidyltransferase domain-containing protein [Ignavibacteriaceae bacterium]|nr:nucleotidyltransferase domain-containing protein [Ignavibacteriaceae bacterium]